MTNRGRIRILLLALACVAGVITPGVPAAAQGPECAGPAPGGEWRTYGGDLQNTRSQPQETVIDAAAAADLQPEFVFRTGEHGSGIVHSTPVVADGCVYFGTTSGWVFAVNADSGELVWKVQLPVQQGGLLCTGVVGSVAVEDGRVFVAVSQAGSPYAVALDQSDGTELWRETMDTTPGVYNCASPVIFEDMVLFAFTGDQTGELNRGGYVIYDLEGEELAKSYTIPDEDIEVSKGGGIWSTAAIDEEAKYAYVGTSNPDAGTVEHPHTNAIVKIDLDRSREETFGTIVGAYKGNPDRYLDLPHPPTCNPDPSIDVFVRSIMCMQMDLDFGASPQLFEGPDGRLRVGNLQKSGVYHVADAETLERDWTAVVAPPFFYSNGSTAATDGRSIFVAGSPPGQLFSLDASDGLYQWVSPLADLLHYQGITYANGLVYTNDAKGFLNIYDADTGLMVDSRPMFRDVGAQFLWAEVSSGSVAVARNTVYVAASGYVVAYRPS